MGGAWLTSHLWEHDAFLPDDDFVRQTAYPLMKGAAEFCLDLLVDDGNGRLVTVPSTSPENQFVTPAGIKHSLTFGATMDMALIRQLFAHTRAAAERLGVDADLCKTLTDAAQRLVPYQILPDGNAGRVGRPNAAYRGPAHRHSRTSSACTRSAKSQPTTAWCAKRSSEHSTSAATTAPAGRSRGKSAFGRGCITARAANAC